MRRWFQQSPEGMEEAGRLQDGHPRQRGLAKPVLGGRLACWRENWGRVESEAREAGAVLRKGRGQGAALQSPAAFGTEPGRPRSRGGAEPSVPLKASCCLPCGEQKEGGHGSTPGEARGGLSTGRPEQTPTLPGRARAGLPEGRAPPRASGPRLNTYQQKENCLHLPDHCSQDKQHHTKTLGRWPSPLMS